MSRIIILFLSIALVKNIYPAGNEKIFFNDWLTAGPFTIPLPVFEQNKEENLKELLKFEHTKIDEPEKGIVINWYNGNDYKWNPLTSNDGNIILNTDGTEVPQILYLAAYIEADKWISGKLEISTCNLFNASLDGSEFLIKTTFNNDSTECKPENKSKEIFLEKGKHLLIIKTINPVNKPLTIKTTFELDSGFTKKDLHIVTTPKRFVSIKNLLEDPKIDNVTISQDGKYSAVTISDVVDDTGKKENWVDIYNNSDVSILKSF
jgi:hypothetical protein